MSDIRERLAAAQEFLLWSRENRFVISELAVDGLQMAVTDLDPKIEVEGSIEALSAAVAEGEEEAVGASPLLPARSAATQMYGEKFGLLPPGEDATAGTRAPHPRGRRS